MLDQIPFELRALPQWVVAGPNKIPINARTGQAADPTLPSTWSTFDEAVHAGYAHVGFVLSRTDPYAIIDLDDPEDEQMAARHRKIYEMFDSYSELSQSGKGIHIVVRGSIPAGVRRDKVEVYPHDRYMIFTGHVLNPRPITERQELLNAIHEEMASTVEFVELVEELQLLSDEELYEMGAGASNAEKFNALWRGDLTGYPSQSEADFALLTMLCFYSKSNEQVRRVFRYSELGKRDKAIRNDDYINRALVKIRSKQHVPHVDLEALSQQVPQSPNEPDLPRLVIPPPPPPIIPHHVAGSLGIPFPPGLIGEMAEYIYSSAIRPVREVALAAAIGFGAGILGRHYNISSTGLNQYIILLASTGTGKEGAVGGIDALLAAVRPQVPVVDEFVGPGTFASGQALARVLDKHKSFVSVLGEIGLTLQQICDKQAAASNVQLRKVLLDIFAKSGWNKWLRPSVYSDSDKNTQLVRAPNVTILGESTPENFYGALTSDHITEGLVPRFLVIEYTGLRPPSNPRAFHHPPPDLIAKLVTACQQILIMMNNDTCMPVHCDSHAHAEMEVFNVYADDMINNSGADDVTRQLWNRAHIKALKLAALVAVGCNLQQPTVNQSVAKWAIELVRRDIENMSEKFSTGVMDKGGDHVQEADIIRAINRYPTLTADQRTQYGVPHCLLERAELIPYAYLKRFLVKLASFKHDRRGAVVAIKIALDDLVKAGTLSTIPSDQVRSTFGLDSTVYYRR